MRENAIQKIKLGFWSLVIVLCLGGIMSIQAMGWENVQQDNKAYYHELENRYLNVVRETLHEEGYLNCGITMTSIVNPAGCRQYEVVIHHDRLDYLTESEQTDFILRMEQISFPDSACAVTYKILE